MADRITLPLKPSEDTPSRVSQGVISSRVAENVGRLISGAYGSGIDVATIRQRFDNPDCQLTAEQIENVKLVSRVFIAGLVGEFQHRNAMAASEQRKADARTEHLKQEAERESAQRKQLAAQSVEHLVNSIEQASDETLERLTARLLKAKGFSPDGKQNAD